MRGFLRGGYRRHGRGSVCRFAGALLGGAWLFAVAAHAQNATWLLSPASGDFETATNWSPAIVPTGTATFGASNTTTITLSSANYVGALQFNAGAPAYSFEVLFYFLELTGTGIANNSSNTPTITNGGAESGYGATDFVNSSTAGNAIIINQRTGSTVFENTSTAGSASITNNSDGFTLFQDTSTAGSASITNNSVSVTFFSDTSTAGSATITTNSGSFLEINSSSTAGNATIITNSGGVTVFQNTASGGQAGFITNAGGIFDISRLSSAGTTVGSIAGAGTYRLAGC